MNIDIIADYHTHSNIARGNLFLLKYILITHGKGSVAENAAAGEKKGLKEIAITDHGYKHLLYGMSVELYKVAREEVNKVNYFYESKKIDFKVLLGVESNIVSKNGDLDINDKLVDYFDIVCAGYHRGAITLESIKLKNNYTEAAINAMMKYDIDILHHPMDPFNPDIIEIGKTAVNRNTALELNKKHKNISVNSIKELKSMGVKFSLGSDAHSPKGIGEFGSAYDLAVSAGLNNDDIINAKGKASRK